jgi:phage-related protein
MPQLGRRVYELRVRDVNQNWRVMVRLDVDAVVIAEVFSKRTSTTPTKVIEACQERLRRYDQAARG